MLDDELAEEGGGRWWDDHRAQWVDREGKKDGFVSTMTRDMKILPEGKPVWGCKKIEIEEVDVRPTGGTREQRRSEESRRVGEGNRQDRVRGYLYLLGRQPSGWREHRWGCFRGREGVQGNGGGMWDRGCGHGMGRRGS